MAAFASKQFQTKRGASFLVRACTPADARAMLELSSAVMSEDVYSLTTADELSLTEEQEAAWIQGHLDHPGHLLLVAEQNGTVVGSLDFSCGHRRRIAHTGEFGMSVAKAHREDGVGRALLAALIEWARAHEAIEKICLKVHATNDRAIGLYRKMGFVEEGRAARELKYGPDAYVDSVLMALFVK
jgi:RimJ/RimL family protein N-acetyltransferase